MSEERGTLKKSNNQGSTFRICWNAFGGTGWHIYCNSEFLSALLARGFYSQPFVQPAFNTEPETSSQFSNPLVLILSGQNFLITNQPLKNIPLNSQVLGISVCHDFANRCDESSFALVWASKVALVSLVDAVPGYRVFVCVGGGKSWFLPLFWVIQP